MALAQDAGLGKLSLTSALAGTLCAFGSFAVLGAIGGGVLRLLGVESTDDISGDWRDVGVATGVVLALVLFVSYLFGGYVAGRMARRAGAANGLLVFVLGVVVVTAVGAALGTQTDTDTVLSNLRSIGVPTTGDEWAAIGTAAGAGALLSMLLGSILGGVMGERWHGKLLTRALDPSVGPEVDLRDATLDDERSATRDRALVSSTGRSDGAHFTDGDSPSEDGDLDGDTRPRRIDNTATTLDADLDRHS